MKEFKFYHGTSSLFVPSILAYGLGAINPTIDHKTYDLLKFLFLICENQLLNSFEYKEIRETTSLMVSQESGIFQSDSGSSQKVHFKHNLIHVSLSENRAHRHAMHTTHGSEIIDRSLSLYKLLKQYKIRFTIPKKYDYYNINSLTSKTSEPIVFEISNIPDDYLIKEDEGNGKMALDFIRENIELLTPREQAIFLYDCNFKLLKPVPPSKLRIRRIELPSLEMEN